MIRIDDTLLQEIGLISLPKAERDQMLRQIYETLEMRVGMRLAERMTDQQLDEFERFIDTNDEAGALKWLETNFPDYKQVVAEELEKLKAEIKKDSATILQTMQSQPTPVSPAPVPHQQYAPQPAQFNPAPASIPQPAPMPEYSTQASPTPYAAHPVSPGVDQSLQQPTVGQPIDQPVAPPQPVQADFVQQPLPQPQSTQQPDDQGDDTVVPSSSGGIPPPPSI